MAKTAKTTLKGGHAPASYFHSVLVWDFNSADHSCASGKAEGRPESYIIADLPKRYYAFGVSFFCGDPEYIKNLDDVAWTQFRQTFVADVISLPPFKSPISQVSSDQFTRTPEGAMFCYFTCKKRTTPFHTTSIRCSWMKMGNCGAGLDQSIRDMVVKKLSIFSIRVHRIFAALDGALPRNPLEILEGFKSSTSYFNSFDEVYYCSRTEIDGLQMCKRSESNEPRKLRLTRDRDEVQQELLPSSEERLHGPSTTAHDLLKTLKTEEDDAWQVAQKRSPFNVDGDQLLSGGGKRRRGSHLDTSRGNEVSEGAAQNNQNKRTRLSLGGDGGGNAFPEDGEIIEVVRTAATQAQTERQSTFGKLGDDENGAEEHPRHRRAFHDDAPFSNVSITSSQVDLGRFWANANSLCDELTKLRNENAKIREELGEERRRNERAEEVLKARNTLLKQELDRERASREQTKQAVDQIQRAAAALSASGARN